MPVTAYTQTAGPTRPRKLYTSRTRSCSEPAEHNNTSLWPVLLGPFKDHVADVSKHTTSSERVAASSCRTPFTCRKAPLDKLQSSKRGWSLRPLGHCRMTIRLHDCFLNDLLIGPRSLRMTNSAISRRYASATWCVVHGRAVTCWWHYENTCISA